MVGGPNIPKKTNRSFPWLPHCSSCLQEKQLRKQRYEAKQKTVWKEDANILCERVDSISHFVFILSISLHTVSYQYHIIYQFISYCVHSSATFRSIHQIHQNFPGRNQVFRTFVPCSTLNSCYEYWKHEIQETWDIGIFRFRKWWESRW